MPAAARSGAAAGQDAVCTDPGRHHDHTSSVAYGSTGASSRSSTSSTARSPATADAAPAGSVAPYALDFTSSTWSSQNHHAYDSAAASAPAWSYRSKAAVAVSTVSASRASAARSTAAVGRSVGGSGSPSTNRATLSSFTASRRPTRNCPESYAVSTPSRADAAQ